MTHTTLLTLFGVISATLLAQATLVVQADFGDFSEISPSITDADLLQTHLASSSITGFDPVGAYAPGLPNGGGLFDGSGSTSLSGGFEFGQAYIDSSTGSEWSATFTFDTSLNTLGYDILEIRSFSGWNSGLASQDFTISYSLIGEEGFSELGRFTQAATNTGMVLQLSDDLGEYLISGVDQIRFLHHTGSGDARGSYRELDIIGSAVAVPEPAAMGLFAGLIGLFAITLRRQKN